ncbi:MAG: glycosyltransferase family 9 protein [Ferruginibacter sp.]
MQAKPAHILLIRFSAMGDVAMAVPVIKELLINYPSLTVTVVSNKHFAAFFTGIERLNFFGADLKADHKGINGLFRLYRQLNKLHAITAVADLHNVLRSKILAGFFRIGGLRVMTINKGRKEKRELVRKEQKNFRRLKTTHQRYADVMYRLGYSFVLKNKVNHEISTDISVNVKAFLEGCKEKKICIAPFAKHKEKMYPLEKMQNVVEMIASENYSIILIGGGNAEKELLDKWEKKMPAVFSAAGQFSLQEEMQIISNCELMISMDSANMHIAAMLGVPVLSVWGATHPYTGFMGYSLDRGSAVQIDLSCRPCSVFGNKPCWRGDHACMLGISEALILETVEKLLPIS